MSFSDFELDPRLLQAIGRLGWSAPQPVQDQAIPHLLRGADGVIQSQTGTGKTAAFGLPLLQKLLNTPRPLRASRALILAPTRELARQVHEHLTRLADGTELTGIVITGGSDDFAPQEHRLRQGSADWIVATPGRLRAHLEAGHTDLAQVHTLVLDEADRLLELGFLPDLQAIVALLPERRQTVLLSATLPPEINQLAKALLHKPVSVRVGTIAPVDTIREELWPVSPRQKFTLLRELLVRRALPSALIFARTRRRAEDLANRLTAAGFRSEALHADRTMVERILALERFRRGEVAILVATDLAARGLDITGITHVINYDVPTTPDDYIHRIGRTGRAGAGGVALTLMAAAEEVLVAKIEQATRTRLAPRRLEDFAYQVDKEPAAPAGKSRPRKAASFTTRSGSTERKASPFTRTGKARPAFEIPDLEKNKHKKRSKKFKMKKRLPHER